MALWTPYADVLDLSKSVKEKPNQVFREEPYYGCYEPQLSPISSSSYEHYMPRTPVIVETTALSPPMSPASKRPHSAIDDSLSDDPDFQAYERDALRVMAERNGGSLLGNNPRMRRSVRSSNDVNDHTYRRQRERNNFAAKQSRDRRKLREIHLALKVSYLRRELAGLTAALAARRCNRCRQTCLC